MLLGIKWYQFVRNDDLRRLTKQPKLTAIHTFIFTSIIQSRRLKFGNIMRMDDNADTKRILLASPPADWRRQLGRPRITWLSTIQQDLKHHHLTLPEAADLAQNRPLWRMMSTYGATQSWVARQKRRRRRQVNCRYECSVRLLDSTCKIMNRQIKKLKFWDVIISFFSICAAFLFVDDYCSAQSRHREGAVQASVRVCRVHSVCLKKPDPYD